MSLTSTSKMVFSSHSFDFAMPLARNSMYKMSASQKSPTFMAHTFYAACPIGDERAITDGPSDT